VGTKYKQMKYWFLSLLIAFPVLLSAQREIGLVAIRNFGMEDFKSQLQNFYVTQDKNGIVYVGNKEGVLEYRGGVWRKHQLSNKNDAQCVAIADNGIIYVGGVNEFGYFMLDTTGENIGPNLRYYSLFERLKGDSISNIGNVTDINFHDSTIYFLTEHHLFIYHQGELHTIKSESSFFGLYHLSEQTIHKKR
jgi:hypothetical protein